MILRDAGESYGSLGYDRVIESNPGIAYAWVLGWGEWKSNDVVNEPRKSEKNYVNG